MIELKNGSIYYGGKFYSDVNDLKGVNTTIEECKKNTLAYSILKSHNVGNSEDRLNIKFDALASHDITYVGIIQTARATGLEKFPVPYVLTNCHNSLCAVGGTINEDDHAFGLSAAVKYGGIYVPPHIAVIHQYMRECFAAPGKMILGSDSHTRYGALGCMAIGEGGPELVKQILGKTYDVDMPKVVAVHLKGKPSHGVGPQDVAIALISKVFANGFVKNTVLEFIGDGVSNISMDYRIGIDVMTTETTCLSSVWETDNLTKKYLVNHGRGDSYKEMKVSSPAYYDGVVDVDLSKIEPMIALPFHPSNGYTIKEFLANAEDILEGVEKNAAEVFGGKIGRFSLRDKLIKGKFCVDQGVIAGCAGGGFENIIAASKILNGDTTGNGVFSLSVYPSSQPVHYAAMRAGAMEQLLLSGATLRTAFCGPCFGAGDVPLNGGLSIRHSTRNFPNREGSKPGEGQLAAVALMDARSIAATAKNKGVLIGADEIEYDDSVPEYVYNPEIYGARVYNGFGNSNSSAELKFGPNITDWPEMAPLTDNLLLKVAAYITDPVTTTDELIPSGETSSFRSNPERLAEFALSRKVPSYVPTAKAFREFEKARRNGTLSQINTEEIDKVLSVVGEIDGETGYGTVVYAYKPGDGSAREQAVSCQKILGTWANIAKEYATKRYLSNLINWGVVPFLFKETLCVEEGDYIFIKDVKKAMENGDDSISAFVVSKEGTKKAISLSFAPLSETDRQIILDGCLINNYRR